MATEAAVSDVSLFPLQKVKRISTQLLTQRNNEQGLDLVSSFFKEQKVKASVNGIQTTSGVTIFWNEGPCAKGLIKAELCINRNWVQLLKRL